MALRVIWRRMTRLDKAVVAGLLLLSVGLLAVAGRRAAGARVVVERAGRVIFTAPLDEDRSVRLSGPRGETRLVIRDGRACITESPCPLKVCMGMGEISRRGELLACVPNRLLVRLEGPGGGKGTYDVISR